MKRLIIVVLAIIFLLSFVLLQTKVGAESHLSRLSEEKEARYELSQVQKQALDELYQKLKEIHLNDTSVPSWLSGELGEAGGKPKAAAVEAMHRLAPAFR